MKRPQSRIYAPLCKYPELYCEYAATLTSYSSLNGLKDIRRRGGIRAKHSNATYCHREKNRCIVHREDCLCESQGDKSSLFKPPHLRGLFAPMRFIAGHYLFRKATVKANVIRFNTFHAVAVCENRLKYSIVRLTSEKDVF